MKTLRWILSFFILATTVSFGHSQTKKVLIIGIDGVRSDALLQANSPNIDLLTNNGTSSYDALNDDITISGPGWSAMLTGVWSDKHGVTDNSFSGQDYDTYPHFFHYVEENNSSLYTASICHWGPINDQIVGEDSDFKLNVGSDESVADEGCDLLQNEDPDVLFLHFDEADGVGHSTGFSPTNTIYLDKIEEIDSLVGEVVLCVTSRANYSSEDWLVLLSTDHGGLGFSHGGVSIEEERIFFIASGDNIPKQEITKDTTVYPPPTNCLSDSVEVVLDGVDDYIEIPINSVYDFGSDQDFTIECRVKTNSTGDVAIVGNKDWDSGNLDGFVFSFKFPSGPEWKVNVGDGTQRADIDTGGLIADGEWYTLTVSFDRDGVMKMYQDGVFIDQTDMSYLGNIDTGNPIRLGVDSDGQYDYNGSVAELRIWNKVIESNEILNWHCTSLDDTHPDYSSLLGHWKINEGGSNSTIEDYSNIGNHASLISGSWSQPNNMIVDDFSLTPRITDIALSALAHLCIDIEASWDLDGIPIYSSCPEFNDPCINDTLILSYINQINHHAEELIISDAYLNHSIIEYQAGEEILLEKGFEVTAGSVFDATIAPCN